MKINKSQISRENWLTWEADTKQTIKEKQTLGDGYEAGSERRKTYSVLTREIREAIAAMKTQDIIKMEDLKNN